MSSELNELQNATVGMIVGVIEVRYTCFQSCSMELYRDRTTFTSASYFIHTGTHPLVAPSPN